MAPADATWLPALLAAAAPEVAATLSRDRSLASALQQAVQDAAASWPDLPLAPDVFAAHLGERIPVEPPLDALLPTLHLDDLWLACACVHAVPKAAATFERRHGPDVRRGLGSAAGQADEMTQDVMRHVLVATEDRPPRIAAYTGRGRLGRWVSVVARRRVIDLGRARPPETGLSQGGQLAAAYGDPESALLHGTLHEAFREAIERAAAAMEARDRNMLRYVYVHQLRLREVAAIYRVDRSTVKRRLARLREQLADEVRDGLRRQLGLDERQLERELAELPAALPITLSRILKQPAS